MIKGKVKGNLLLIVTLSLMVVSAFSILGVIRSRAIFGGALGIAFVAVSVELWMTFKELTTDQ